MNIQDTTKDLLASVSSILEKKNVKEVDEPKAKGEKDFKDLHTKDLEVYSEKLDPKADASEWIEDFIKSDAPQFKGKSKEERKEMALAAYYSARKKAGLKEGADKDVKGDKEAYQKFFQGMLKKFGVKSPAELSGDKEKEFYDAIDAGWKGDDEKKESVNEAYTPKTLPYRIIDMEGPKAQLKIVKHVKRKSGNKSKDIYFDGDDFVIGSKTAVAGALKSGSKVIIQDLIDAAKAAMESLEESNDDMYRWPDVNKALMKVMPALDIARVAGKLKNKMDGDKVRWGDINSVLTSLKPAQIMTVLSGLRKKAIKEAKSATGYEIYHKDFSTAMQHAYDFAKKKLKVEVDPEEISREVAMGPKRPSTGKTNSYRLKGKGGAIQVQVYNTGKNYELNMYKESVKEDSEESIFQTEKIEEASAKQITDIIKKHFENAAPNDKPMMIFAVGAGIDKAWRNEGKPNDGTIKVIRALEKAFSAAADVWGK